MTNVLVVEDHSIFSQALELTLRHAFADKRDEGSSLARGTLAFAHAPTLAEGLRLVSEREPFDLAVVDLMLPDGNGVEVVREIKAQSPHTSVAVLSANEDLSGALAAGADEAISKATGLPQIVASLLTLLKDRT